MSIPAGWTLTSRNLKPRTVVIFDPDSKNITADGRHDINNFGILDHGFELNLDFWGEVILRNIKLFFSNVDGFFDPYLNEIGDIVLSDSFGYLPLRSIQWIIGNTTTMTSASFKQKYRIFRPRINDIIVFTDGINRETITVNSVSCAVGTPSICTVGFPSGSLVNTYNEYDLAMIEPVLGRDVVIKIRLDGSAGDYEIFRGIARSAFSWNLNNNKTSLDIDNKFGLFLNREMRIQSGSPTPTQRCNSAGSLASTIAWTTQTGNGTLSGVTVYVGSKLGEWIVTFSDDTNFTVTGPNCFSKAGSTGADFYDNTDASDSQICIPSANWGGTPAADDVLHFYISVNFSAKTVAEIIYDLLNIYAEIPSGNIDVGGTGVTDTSEQANYRFNKAYYLLQTETLIISFSEPITITEAILAVLPHAMAQLTLLYENKIGIHLIHPDFYVGGEYNALEGETDNYRIEILPFVNEFIVHYGWDYENGSYQYTYTYPEKDSENRSLKMFNKKVSKEIFLPGFYSNTNPEAYAKRYYSFFKCGVPVLQAETSLAMLEYDVGEKLNDAIYTSYNAANSQLIIYKIENSLIDKYRINLHLYAKPENEDGAW